MDFEPGIDSIDLSQALSVKDLASAAERLKLTEEGGSASLTLLDEQGQELQHIRFDGLSESQLLGQDPAAMSDSDKLTQLLQGGQLILGDNFGSAKGETLHADAQGSTLYGFGGDDSSMPARVRISSVVARATTSLSGMNKRWTPARTRMWWSISSSAKTAWISVSFSMTTVKS